MTVRTLLFFVLLFPALCLHAQITRTKKLTPSSSQATPIDTPDDLTKHLSAAETYQLSGDLDHAAVENRAIISIALKRLGALALRENQPMRAVKLLNDSITLGDAAETRANLAVAYLRSSEIDHAIANAQAAANLDPQNANAQHLLGKLLYAKGDYSHALAALESTIVIAPDFDTAYTLGLTYLQLKQIDRARLLFEEMQTALKNSADLHVLIGQAYEQTGYYPEAEAELKQALSINPKIQRAHFFIGYLILQHGGSERLTEAGKEFEQELQLNPADFYSNFFRGVVSNVESEHAKAIPFLQKAVQLNPNVGEAYLFLGQSQGELGDQVSAEKSLRRSIELTVDASKNSFQIRRAHFLLGRVLLKSGRKAEAEKELLLARQLQGQLLDSARDEVGRILGQVVSFSKNSGVSAPAITGQSKIESPTARAQTEETPLSKQEAAEFVKVKAQLSQLLAQAYHNLGVIAAQQGALGEAMTRFASAAEWQPDFPGLDRNWGITGFRAAQFDKAVAPLARQVKAHPEDALARRMLGVSYYLTQNYKQALETLKPLETSLSSDPELAYFYGISLVKLDKQPQAIVLFARLSDQNPKSAQARFYAAQGFAIVGDYERAVKEFRSVAALDSAFAQAHFSAGQSLIRLNRLDEAEKEFRQELQLNAVDAAAKYYLAYTLLERKIQIDEALSLLKEAVSLRYDYADARYQLGKALIEKGELDEAVEQLETAARFEPKKDYIHYQLSIAYRRASRPTDADRELKLYRDLKSANRTEETPGTMGAKENAP